MKFNLLMRLQVANGAFNRWNHCLRQSVYAEDGLTLLEVIVSLALTLILMGGLLNLMLLGINNVSQGGGRTAACIYASSLLEEMKARPELLAGVVGVGQISADSMPFLQCPPAGIEAQIEYKLLAGTQHLYIVNVKVLTTGGNHQWEESMVGVVPVP